MVRLLRATAVLAALLLCAGGAAADERYWYADVAPEGGGVAAYGIPETDDQPFLMECSATSPEAIQMFPGLYSLDEPPRGTDVIFNVDGASFERAARYVFHEGVAAWATVLIVNRADPLVTALRRGRHVVFAHEPPRPGQPPVSVPLDGSAAAIRTMLSQC